VTTNIYECSTSSALCVLAAGHVNNCSRQRHSNLLASIAFRFLFTNYSAFTYIVSKRSRIRFSVEVVIVVGCAPALKVLATRCFLQALGGFHPNSDGKRDSIIKDNNNLGVVSWTNGNLVGLGNIHCGKRTRRRRLSTWSSV
jgi:hypothetical protein